jgi:3'-phosphoadenosine 5'-phosphosulfate sulfotransferase (PAPS reductase)/FAD synthetase
VEAKVKTEKKKVSDLKFYPGNPRTMPKSVLEKLKKSILEFGIVEPLVINPKNEVIGGNQRLKALQELGIEEVDCVVVDLPKQKEKALNLALNKISGQWDLDLLKSFVLDFDLKDLDLAGFFENEIHNLFKSSKAPELPDFDKYERKETEEEIEKELNHAEQIYVSFSGGRDSTLATLLIKKYWEKVKLLYVDIKYEIPTIKLHVIETAEKLGLKLVLVPTEKDFFSYYEQKKSFPSTIYRDCISSFIVKSLNDYIFKETENFVLVRGAHPQQRTRRAKSSKFYTLWEGKRKVKIYNPLFDLSEDEKQKFFAQMQEQGLLWEGYLKGFVRTACWLCPFQTKQQYEALQKFYPCLWEILVRKNSEWKHPSEDTLFRYLRGKE